MILILNPKNYRVKTVLVEYIDEDLEKEVHHLVSVVMECENGHFAVAGGSFIDEQKTIFKPSVIYHSSLKLARILEVLKRVSCNESQTFPRLHPYIARRLHRELDSVMYQMWRRENPDA